MIDGRRHDIVLHGQYGDHCLDSSGSTKQVARHRLRRRDVELEGCIAKHLLDGLSLGDVAYVGRRAVNIDVVDVLGFHTCILQRVLHDELCTQALRMRGCDVVSICAHAGTNHFGIDLGTASLSVLQFFENQASGTFGHDKSVA